MWYYGTALLVPGLVLVLNLSLVLVLVLVLDPGLSLGPGLDLGLGLVPYRSEFGHPSPSGGLGSG